MHFVFDHIAVGILLLLFLLAGVVKHFFFPSRLEPSLNFSQMSSLPFHSLRTKLAPLPLLLQKVGLAFFILAFIDPHIIQPYVPSQSDKKSTEVPTQGIAIYLLLDQSGSMNEEVSSRQGVMPKIQLLKKVTTTFIQDHSTDLIGLIAFARIPRILVPLTLDQEELLTQLSQLETVKDPNDDGTAMGYAIFKAANLISATRHFAQDLPADAKPAYEIKNSIIVVVTDGLQDPNRLDYDNRLRTIELDDAANYAKSQGIKVYIVNVDPGISSQEFAPQRRQMQSITELTGGRLFLVNQSQDLQEVYQIIDHLEKETIPTTRTVDKSEQRRFNIFPYLIFLGLLSIFSGLTLDSFVIRRVP